MSINDHVFHTISELTYDSMNRHIYAIVITSCLMSRVYEPVLVRLLNVIHRTVHVNVHTPICSYVNNFTDKHAYF